MYKLPTLAYSFEELEPFIDTHTMGLHYHKHEQNYLNKLNELLKKNNFDYRYNVNELLFHLNEFPKEDQEDILFNLGGVLNHNLYWNSMSPNPELPKGILKMYLDQMYGSYDKFYEEFKRKALQLKGSGYTVLVIDKDCNLKIINISNQHLPLLDGYIPLFIIDMWEHAYYLNYENEKKQYLENFQKIANFSYANNLVNNIMHN